MREYDSYTVAYTDMGAGGMEGGAGGDSPVLGSPALTGGAFNTLASYLFGAFCVSARDRLSLPLLPSLPAPLTPLATTTPTQATTRPRSPWP